jgi:hypothetical protein
LCLNDLGLNCNAASEDTKADLSLRIIPVGDTTSREISDASQELRDVLENLPGIARVEPHRVPAPDHAKGALVERLAVSSFHALPP